jgi:hypothetical protein
VFRLRRILWTGHVAHVEERKHVYRILWTGHVAHVEEKKRVYRILVVKLGEKQLARWR